MFGSVTRSSSTQLTRSQLQKSRSISRMPITALSGVRRGSRQHDRAGPLSVSDAPRARACHFSQLKNLHPDDSALPVGWREFPLTHGADSCGVIDGDAADDLHVGIAAGLLGHHFCGIGHSGGRASGYTLFAPAGASEDRTRTAMFHAKSQPLDRGP